MFTQLQVGSIQIIAAEGPNGRFLPSDIKEQWWAILAFLVVGYFLASKGLPLIKEALEKGQAEAVADATAAEAQVAESRAKIAAATTNLGDANAESERIIAEAKQTAQQLRVDSANRTQQLVNDMWAKAQSDVGSLKEQASADISTEVASQAMGAAEQVVHSSLDAAGHADLVNNYINGLGVTA